MTSKLLQILDDNSGDFKYSGGQWTLSTLIQWYQGTSNYPAFANSTTFGSFTLSFEGTSIAFVGNTPPDGFSQTATVSIDGGAPYTITYSTTPPPAYVQWYQSPTLSDGTHTITVDDLDATSVDYALIEVGQNTPLAGKTIVVDDEDPAIQYSGNWNLNTAEFKAGSLPDGFPLHNSTHQSATPGDTVTFRFSGTAAAIYGIFNWDNLGLLSATYTLDGTTLPQSYPVTTASPEYVSGDAEAINFLYFSQDNLSAGDHTLVINITECQNQVFMLDYITYTPSFSTLATMPNLITASASPLSPSSFSTSQISSSTSGLATSASTATTQTGSLNPSSSSTSKISSLTSGLATSASTGTTQNGSQSSQDETNAKGAPVGAIVGSIVGGVLLLALLAFLLIWMRKRRSDTELIEQTTAQVMSPSIHPSTTLNANAGGASYSSALETGQLSPVRRGFGWSDGTVSPFQDPPGAPAYYGSGTMADLKRERDESSNMRSRGAPTSPFAGVTNHSTSSETVNAPSTASMDLEYLPDRVGRPPAYDALSAHHPHPNMPLPSQTVNTPNEKIHVHEVTTAGAQYVV